MSALGAIEEVGFGFCAGLFLGGIALGVGDASCFAVFARVEAVDNAEDEGRAGGKNDVAILVRDSERVRHVRGVVVFPCLRIL